MNSIELKFLPDFIEAYQKACKQKAETFMFSGSEVLTNYAKYLIEYAMVRLHEHDTFGKDGSAFKHDAGAER